jgi:ribose-phosphate pyrophosphokinase
MQAPIVLAHPGGERLAAALAAHLQTQQTEVDIHRFPDGECCPRIQSDVAGREVVIACALDRPDPRSLSLYLLASALREQRARRILLAVPYLPYMRQDRPFARGEGTSARHFARWLSSFIDGLVTVDPHLHRIHSLDEIYSVPTRVVAAAPAIAGWVAANVGNPVLIGPDQESEQWVAHVARLADCPATVLEKKRHGDHEVEISLPDVALARGRTAVLVDDIISTAGTMITAIRQLRKLGLQDAVCVGVHAIFAGDAWPALQAAGPARIVSGNTVEHPTNEIDVHPLMAAAVAELLTGSGR